MPASRLLERDDQLVVFDGLIDAATRGVGAVALVEGPPGIGKTRLAAEARERAEEAGMETIAARAGALERDVAWGVVRTLLGPALTRRTEGERADLLSGAARLAGPIVGQGGEEDAALIGSEGIGAALHGLYWLTANIAERSPLLAVVDDAQWADLASLRWVAYMARRIEELPILLLVACRQAEPGVDMGVIAALRTEPAARTVLPAPLTERGSAQMVRSGLSVDADQAFCGACHAATGGNPFLLHELIGQLAADGVAPTAAAAMRIEEMRPETISRVVLLRLRRLPEDARALVRATAVLEPLATVARAAELADIEHAAGAAAADTLAAADILALGRPLEFVHPLVRAAVYEDIPRAQRALMHGRAARLLDRDGMSLEDQAVHLLAAEPAADAWCVTTLRRAAVAALDVGAPDVAAGYLRRALDEPPPHDERGGLLWRLGLAEASVGSPDATEHLSAALDQASDPIERAHVALDLGRALINAGELERACAVLDRAVGELNGSDRDLALRLEAELLEAAGYGLSLRPVFVERLRRLRPAELEGATPGERVVLSRVALDMALGTGTARETAETARRALAGGRLLAESAESQGSLDAADALLLADQFDEAERIYDEALAHARARGSLSRAAMATHYRALVAYWRGRVDEAVAAARDAIDAHAAGAWEYGMPVAACLLAEALIERGELEEAAAALERGAGRLPADSFPFNRILYTRGKLQLAEGALADGIEDLVECGRRLEAWGAQNPTLFPWRSIAAPALALLGRQEDAARLAGDELEAARRFGARRPLGVALRASGLVEGADGGIALLREAVEVLVSSHARLEEARARTDLGAALRRAGRRRECMAPLRQGLDLASACGATALAVRARQELIAAGARPRRDALRGRDALTATESRVAEMAAAGMTNREIAQALFVTLRTVETHLTHAFPKLGIRSRRELPEALGAARR